MQNIYQIMFIKKEVFMVFKVVFQIVNFEFRRFSLVFNIVNTTINLIIMFQNISVVLDLSDLIIYVVVFCYHFT